MLRYDEKVRNIALSAFVSMRRAGMNFRVSENFDETKQSSSIPVKRFSCSLLKCACPGFDYNRSARWMVAFATVPPANGLSGELDEHEPAGEPREGWETLFGDSGRRRSRH
jgi:hypothetical protein